MPRQTPAQFYQAEYIDKGYERLDLFKLLADHYPITTALYPGSYIHVTPSFVFSLAVYADMDKRARQFFDDPATLDFIAGRKQYEGDTSITFHSADYRAGLPETDGRFDLLISQYAGFISQPCKRYLKIGGWLLVNNSHGDASMASLDADYELAAVILGSEGHFRLSEQDLGAYFVPKNDTLITQDYIAQIGRGVGYQKSASHYLFRRVR